MAFKVTCVGLLVSHDLGLYQSPYIAFYSVNPIFIVYRKNTLNILNHNIRVKFLGGCSGQNDQLAKIWRDLEEEDKIEQI